MAKKKKKKAAKGAKDRSKENRNARRSDIKDMRKTASETGFYGDKTKGKNKWGGTTYKMVGTSATSNRRRTMTTHTDKGGNVVGAGGDE